MSALNYRAEKDIFVKEMISSDMETPVLNAHNKAEHEQSHTDAFDTYPF